MPSQIIGSKGQRVYEAADGAAAGAGGGGAAIIITDNRTSGGAGYATVSSGTLVFAGGNNITLSQDGSSITISGGAGAGGLGAGISTLGNTLGDTGFVTGRLIFAGLGAVSLSGSTNGASMSVSISAPAQTVQTQGIGSVGISGGNTAGDTGTHTLGRLVFAGGSNVTLSGSSNGVSRTISIAAADQTVQTQGGFAQLGISGGNTAGDTGAATRARVVFAGHSNITLSGSTNGASLTISASVADQTVQTQGGFAQIGISGGNTLGDTGAATRARVVFAGGNSITLSGSTNGASHTITIVGPSQTVQTQGGFAQLGISGGNTAGDTGAATRDRLVFAGAGIITLSGSTNGGSHTISISAAAGAGFAGGGISGGNTAGDTGSVTARLIFAGGNNVTLSGSTNGGSQTISIVGATLTNSSFSAGISGGNTAGDTGTQSGRLVFAGANSITLSGSSSNNGNQTISIVGPTITQSSYSAGISGGNTAGDTGTQTGRLVFAGGANITLSGSSSNNGNQTITIVGPAPGAGGFLGGGISGGNTAGDTGSVTARLIFAGGANITLSGSTNGGSQTISIVGPTQSVQTNAVGSFGISGGNTSGDTGAATRDRLVFAGVNDITLSGSTNAGSMTLSIVGNRPDRLWHNITIDPNNSSNLGLSNSTSIVVPLMLEYDVTADFMRMPVSMQTSSAATFATTNGLTFTQRHFTTHNAVFYTRGSGANSLSLQSIFSTSVGNTAEFSFSAAAATGSQWTLSYRHSFWNGTASSLFSTTYATTLTNVAISGASSRWWSNATGTRFYDIPVGSTFQAGPVWLAYGYSTTNSTGGSNINSAHRLQHSNYMMNMVPLAWLVAPLYAATASSIMQFPGVGMYSNGAGVTTASLDLSAISSQVRMPVLALALMAAIT